MLDGVRQSIYVEEPVSAAPGLTGLEAKVRLPPASEGPLLAPGQRFQVFSPEVRWFGSHLKRSGSSALRDQASDESHPPRRDVPVR